MARTDEIIVAVLTVAEAFGKSLSEQMLKVYVRVLSDVPSDALLTGTDAMLKSAREFMPSPGQLRNACLLDGDSVESRALSAWGVAVDARRKAGPRDSVRFSDPLIAASIRRVAVDWPNFAYKLRDGSADFLRKSFVECYRAMLEHGHLHHDGKAAVMLGSEAMGQSDWARERYGVPVPIVISSPYAMPKSLTGPSRESAQLTQAKPQLEYAI